MTPALAANVWTWCVTVGLIYFHQRWASFDPFNPARRGGTILTMIMSALVATGFQLTTSFLAAGNTKAAAFAGWLCIGSMIGAVTTGGTTFRTEEIRDPFERWLAERREWAKGIAFGAFVVGLISSLLSFLPWHPPSHAVVFALTLLLGVGRLAKAFELNGTEELGPIYERPGVGQSVVRTALLGLISVSVLYWHALPVLSQLPKLTLLETATYAGFVVGALITLILG